jgi:hypothetical protein
VIDDFIIVCLQKETLSLSLSHTDTASTAVMSDLLDFLRTHEEAFRR